MRFCRCSMLWGIFQKEGNFSERQTAQQVLRCFARSAKTENFYFLFVLVYFVTSAKRINFVFLFCWKLLQLQLTFALLFEMSLHGLRCNCETAIRASLAGFFFLFELWFVCESSESQLSARKADFRAKKQLINDKKRAILASALQQIIYFRKAREMQLQTQPTTKANGKINCELYEFEV